VSQDSRATLLQRWQTRQDREALDCLLRLELEALKRGLRYRDGGAISSATLDDVTQDVVLRFLRAAPRELEHPAALRSYLWTAARTALIDHLRERRLVPFEVGAGGSSRLQQDPLTTGSLGKVDGADLASALELALNLVGSADQEILRLVYFRGLSIETAGRELGIERDVANTRLVRARVRLAEKLAAWKELIGE
jgi:RNA polymerase sigma factor (sigma-70 family)